MNKTIMPILLVITFACSPSEKKETRSEGNKKIAEQKTSFDWLLGKWKRVEQDSATETYESWQKVNDTNYVGHGFVMQGADTVWQESMVLAKGDSVWALEVNTPGNDDLVRFGMTEMGGKTFTVENPQHDFPKKIQYWQDAEKLKAKIFGDGKEAVFEFEYLGNN